MKNLPYFILFAIVFMACSSDDKVEELSEENFYALKVGNSWTYNYFSRVGQTEEFENLGAVDVMAILSEKQINGDTYYEMQTTTTYGGQNCVVCPEEGIVSIHVKDSLGFLVDTNGRILYSSEDVVFEYPLFELDQFEIFGTLLSVDTQLISVEAGNFNSLNNEIFAVSKANGSIYPGRDHVYYSDGVGQILRNYSGMSNPQHSWERRLMSYTLN